MKYYIIAGEASGDLHGSNLIKEIHKKDVDNKKSNSNNDSYISFILANMVINNIIHP